MRIIPLAFGLATMLFAVPVTRAASAEYRQAPCAGDFAHVTNTVSCGLLLVDETRGSGNGRRVSIPVAVVRALHPRPGALPVVFLHGGPGDEVISGLPDLLRSEHWKQFIAQDQDWIFLDQRGGGLSAPLLDCGARLLLNDAGPLSASAADALIACAARHVAAGVDLSAYNAMATTADLQDLLQLMHLQQVDVVGVSYGTRIAFTLLRLHPGLVRSAVLDSVWPPEALWAEGGPKMIADAVHLLFARCAADRACHAAFANPERDLRTLASRLLAGPMTIGDKTYTADDLGGFLMDTLYSAQGARSLPRDVRAFARGDFRALDEMKATSDTYFELQHLTHLCKEEFPFERRDHVADGVEGDPVGLVSVQSFQRYFDVCDRLPVGAPVPAEGQPLSSDVPTLFLSAEFDPGCPPALARAAASRFGHSQFAQFPNSTHGLVRVSTCARAMVLDFLRDPSRPVDRSCISGSQQPFGFVVRGRPRDRD